MSNQAKALVSVLCAVIVMVTIFVTLLNWPPAELPYNAAKIQPVGASHVLVVPLVFAEAYTEGDTIPYAGEEAVIKTLLSLDEMGEQLQAYK